MSQGEAEGAPIRGGGEGRSAKFDSLSSDTNAPRGGGNKGKARQVKPSQAPPRAEEQAESAPQQLQGAQHDEYHPEGETCFICAEPVKLYSVAPCDHRTCHICAIRLRALYKKIECTFCKAEIDRLIFTSSVAKTFAEFTPSETPYQDKKLHILFETKDAMEETLILLRFNCPEPRCQVASTGWQDFKIHARRDHSRLLCDLCVRHKKIFAHEHTLHTSQSLKAHMDTEHRLCEYCREYFYGDDELFVHMRDRHEQCHICKARGTEADRWKYLRNYNMLERHFRDDHFLCLNQDCLDKKFIVFENEMDFKAHQLEEHANELTSREKREALRIEANFTYEEPDRRGKRKGKAREEPAATDLDPLTVSRLLYRSEVPGAGPANHASRRAMFGGNLTTPSLQGVAGPSETSTISTEERHAAFLSKVTKILRGSEARVASFRSSVRVYCNGEMSARDLVDNIHSLVGDIDDCATVINGLVDLLDDESKKRNVLGAWNGLRIERTQFPSLAQQPKGQVRNAKSSAAASSHQVWLNIDRAASASSGHGTGKPSVTKEHFPSLSTKTPSSGKVSIPGSLAHAVASSSRVSSGSKTPWVGSVSKPRPTAAPTPYVMRATGAGGGMTNVSTRNTSAFPSLPTNAKAASLQAQKRALFTKGSGASSPSVSGTLTPWSSPSGSTRIDGGLDLLEGLNEALTEPSGGKKGKKKGTPLMSLGGIHRG